MGVERFDRTVFDSTGIAIEDVAVAKHVYEKAKMETASYISLDIIESK
jgi:ornithine cyclodeaminase/alanine dehydrogenase-like protein (mu-crystallin family)